MFLSSQKEQTMTQYDLENAVACATGESLCEIRHRGFSIADPHEVRFDPEPDQLIPQMIDWDDESQRNIPILRCRRTRGKRTPNTRRLQSVR